MTDRQAQMFWDASSEPEHDPCCFAVGGKGLASAAGAADARNKARGELRRDLVATAQTALVASSDI